MLEPPPLDGVRITRNDAKESIFQGGVVSREPRFFTWVMMLDTTLFRRVQPGTICAALTKPPDIEGDLRGEML